MQKLLFIVLVYSPFLGTTDFWLSGVTELQSFHCPLQCLWPRQTKTLRHLQEFYQCRASSHCASLPQEKNLPMEFPVLPDNLFLCTLSTASAWTGRQQGAAVQVSHSKRSQLGAVRTKEAEAHAHSLFSIKIPCLVKFKSQQLQQRNGFFILV